MTTPSDSGGESEKPDLILGSVKDYEFEQVEPFLTSLRRTGYAGKVVFFAENLGRRTVQRLHEAGVEVRPVSTYAVAVPGSGRSFHLRHPAFDRPHRLLVRALSSFPGIRGTIRRAIFDRVALPFLMVYAARYLRYSLYLRAHAGRYRNVMVTDVRDVLFQREPFDFPFGDEVCCFLEDERYTIGAQGANRQWILEAYGPEVLRELEHRPISCSGITLGPETSMVAYVETMSDAIARLTGAARRLVGIDQGVHNYLLHQGRIARARVFRNNDGPVLTIGLMDPAEIRCSEAGEVVDRNGRVINILHQYDRLPDPEPLVRRLTR